MVTDNSYPIYTIRVALMCWRFTSLCEVALYVIEKNWENDGVGAAANPQASLRFYRPPQNWSLRPL